MVKKTKENKKGFKKALNKCVKPSINSNAKFKKCMRDQGFK